jgi:hypothetical protein
LTNGSLQIDRSTAFLVNINVGLTFDEVNAGRTFNVRLYDLVTAAPIGDVLPISVGRNTGGSFVQISQLIDTFAANEAIVVQIGGGSDFTNTVITHAGYFVSSVGQ